MIGSSSRKEKMLERTLTEGPGYFKKGLGEPCTFQ